MTRSNEHPAPRTSRAWMHVPPARVDRSPPLGGDAVRTACQADSRAAILSNQAINSTSAETSKEFTVGIRQVAVVATVAAAWTVVVSALAVWRHQQFLSHRYDLGNMVQAVWSTVQGRPLEVTDGATGEQIVRLGAHVDPILALMAPLWVLFPSPEILILTQAALLASGLYPVVRLAEKYVGDRIAVVLLGAWYLVFPWLTWSAFNDFHPVTLATPLLLYAIWFLDEHRLGWFAMFAGLALLTGELVGLTIAALGLWYAVRYRRVLVGLAIAFASSAWTFLCLAVVIPAFNDGNESRFYSRFESTGGSPSGVLATLVSDPTTIAAAMTTSADQEYVLALLAPTAFVAILSPLVLVAALPPLAVNLLSDWWSATQPQFHYSAALLPALIAATIMAVRRFHERFRSIVCAVVLGSAIVALAFDPPRPGAQEFVFGALEPSARREAMRTVLDRIPSADSVTASNRLGAHLSERRRIHLFPTRTDSEWVVLDLRDPWLQVAGEQANWGRYRVEVQRLDSDQSWRLMYDQEQIRLYRRVRGE